MSFRWPYEKKPLIVFWEMTKACLLSCKHCRAESITEPLPDELTTKEGMMLIDQITGFGSPYPILILTGGDPLMRKDLWDIIDYAKSLGLRIALAPSVTPLLNDDIIKEIKKSGISSVSISLDSPDPEVHDYIRGLKGTWHRTINVVKKMIKEGIKVQINTVVMRSTVYGLARMVKLLKEIGVDTWEVFYLVPVGRANFDEDLSPQEWEDVSHFLYEASKYGIKIRTTEGPMFRRVALIRKALEMHNIDPDSVLKTGPLYRRLVSELREILGEPKDKSLAHTTGTRDGKGIVFVSYNGNVYPSGFLPVPAGNVRVKSLVDIYRNSLIFRKLRRAEFRGRCGSCEFREICGGSRARAYSYFKDFLAEDPACPYKPHFYDGVLNNIKIKISDILMGV